MPLPPMFKMISYFLILAAGLPFLFYSTKGLAWDRWIGDFSYPVYISHFLVIDILRYYLKVTGPDDPHYGRWVTIATLLLSYIFLYTVIYPIDRIRERRVGNPRL